MKTLTIDRNVRKALKNQTFRFLVTVYGLIAILGVVLGALLKI